MIDARVFIGEPINYNGICNIYPPRVREVLNEPDFSKYVKLLTYSQEDLNYDLSGEGKPEKKVTPLEYLLINSYYDEEFYRITINAFKFFTHEDIELSYENKEILLLDDGMIGPRKISEDQYFDFQNMLRDAIGFERTERPEVYDESTPAGRIKAKLALANQKRRRAKEKNKREGLSLGTYLNAICCMGIGLNPLSIGEISYAAVGEIINMYQEKEKYETDISAIFAGGDSKKIKPKYWIREKSDTVNVDI